MDTAIYDQMRHFADSWGLLYLMAILLVVVAFIFRPGAGMAARRAAEIPLNDEIDSSKDQP